MSRLDLPPARALTIVGCALFAWLACGCGDGYGCATDTGFFVELYGIGLEDVVRVTVVEGDDEAEASCRTISDGHVSCIVPRTYTGRLPVRVTVVTTSTKVVRDVALTPTQCGSTPEQIRLDFP